VILTGPEITRQVRAGRIVIDPFDESNMNPNSYNFTLGPTMHCYCDFPLDPRRVNECEEIEIPAEGYVLEPGRLYLGHTVERLGSNHFAPTYSARSSVARLGLFINLSASLGDIGFVGQWTLQLVPTHPLRVYAHMRIGQMMFWSPKGEIILYDGKYQASKGPQRSQIYRDFGVAHPEPDAVGPAVAEPVGS
jgi:rifampicin phosphotransferase